MTTRPSLTPAHAAPPEVAPSLQGAEHELHRDLNELRRQVRALQDQAAVAEVRARFARALDDRDWAAFGALFADDVDADFSAYGIAPRRFTRAELVASWRHNLRRPGLRTQHLVGLVRVTVDGDRATCASTFRAHHRLPGFAEGPGGETFTLYGGYDDRLVRTADGWRIAGLTFHQHDAVGNPAVIG